MLETAAQSVPVNCRDDGFLAALERSNTGGARDWTDFAKLTDVGTRDEIDTLSHQVDSCDLRIALGALNTFDNALAYARSERIDWRITYRNDGHTVFRFIIYAWFSHDLPFAVAVTLKNANTSVLMDSISSI